MTYKRKTQSRLNSSFFFLFARKKNYMQGGKAGAGGCQGRRGGEEGRGSEVCRFRNFFFLCVG